MKIPTILVGAFLAATLSSSTLANIMVVPGTANIFGSGFATPSGGGSLPPLFSFSSGSGLVLSFSSVTGSVSSGAFNFGPDGEGPTTFGTNMDSFQGLSGVRADTSFLLFAAFLDTNSPTGASPADLDFRASGLTPDFLNLAPAIGQIFYVGDGRTGTGGAGTVQTFQVPVGATRLFLGIADGQFDGTNVFGAPTNYHDNAGSFTANFDIVPEPTSTVFLLCGAALCLRRRSLRTHARNG